MVDREQCLKSKVMHLLARMAASLSFVFFLMKRNPLSLVGTIVLLAFILLGIVGPYITPYDPTETDMTSMYLPPSALHWMGTDALGRDVFSRVLSSASIDLAIAVFGVLFASLVGLTYGIISSYYGRWVDEIMMRLLDSLQAFPTIILGIVVATILGASAMNVIFVLAFVNFPMYARLTRSQVLSLKQSQFVDAARTVGNSNFRIMFRHLLPNILGPLYVQGSLNIGWSVLMAATLSFVGLGVQPPTPEWGRMISDGARYMVSGEWWMAFFPGLFIFVFVFAANLFGDGLQDVFDPKRR